MNLTSRFQQILHTHPEKNILGYKQNGSWKWVNRDQLKNKVLFCVHSLQKRISIHDRVMYKGNNSVNWVAWSIATNALGGTFVPLYNNQNDNYVNHIINDCNPSVFITNDDYKGVTIMRDAIEDGIYGETIPIEHKSDVAKLIYTSGTTGKPKGVMLTHENMLHNIQNVEKTFSDLQTDKTYTTLNILPWAHIYGLTTELYYNLLNNNKIAISSGPQEFIKEIREIRPELLYLVPRVLQTIKQKLEILDKPLIRRILPFVLNKMFGSNLVTIFIGGSQLDQSTKQFYLKYNISFCEGYGCTETSPMISVNHIHNPRNEESVGKILDDLIVEIIDTEICVAGPSIMKGYYRNDEATNNAFIRKDGNLFYKTGDQGYVENGFLFYKGRISENYKLSNGKFVNIGDVENIVKKHTNELMMVYGNNKDYNILIVEESSSIESYIPRINEELDSYLRIKHVLKIPDNSFQNHLTPKMSLKRKEVEETFQKDICEIYSKTRHLFSS
jgi:long-chain acyl-CoA synthetase